MPLTDDVQLISVDDHVIEPPNVLVDRLPAKYAEIGPHIVDGPDDTQDWVWEGRHYPVALQGSPHTRRFRGDGTGHDFTSRSYADMVEAAYDVHERVKAMDEDGVHAQLLFPTFPHFAGTAFLQREDKDLTLLVVQAYNDWMIDEWCAAYPDRFIPMVITPLWDVELAAAEIRRCAATGAKAVSFPENPYPLGLPSFASGEWEPVFVPAEESNVALCMHIGTSGSLSFPSPDTNTAVPIAICGTSAMSSCADLIFSGLLHRHPSVRIALSEGRQRLGRLPRRADGLHVGADAPRRRQVDCSVGAVPPPLLDLLHQRPLRDREPPRHRHRPVVLGGRLPAQRLELAQQPQGHGGAARERARRRGAAHHGDERPDAVRLPLIRAESRRRHTPGGTA
jgi:predicted TIM-barrel fold metal-dependent hydrolase